MGSLARTFESSGTTAPIAGLMVFHPYRENPTSGPSPKLLGDEDLL